MLSLMKASRAKHRKEANVRSEVERAVKVVAVLATVFLLMFGWKQLVAPALLSDFTGTPFEETLSVILLIMGFMAVLILLLAVQVTFLQIKTSALMRKMVRVTGGPLHAKTVEESKGLPEQQ